MGSAVQPITAKPQAVSRHHVRDLVRLFDLCFSAEFNTRLVPGGEEPEYLPAQGCAHARIISTRDYYASALHEVAHWCVAGPERRQRPDYGYWYAPDGRDAAQQAAFEQVEVKPQALEWLFSAAAGSAFHVSADNLDQGLGASAVFKRAIADQARHYLARGLPRRAQTFFDALADFYGSNPQRRDFSVDQL